MIDTTSRTDEREIMDDFTLEGKALRTNLDILASINKWLGGNQVSLNGIQKLIKKLPRDQKLVIVDLGCGNGDMLRRISQLKPHHLFGIIKMIHRFINYSRPIIFRAR